MICKEVEIVVLREVERFEGLLFPADSAGSRRFPQVSAGFRRFPQVSADSADLRGLLRFMQITQMGVIIVILGWLIIL